MKPFLRLEGIAAPLPIANVDTDRIIPAAFLKGTSRTGLGQGLFSPLRYDLDGREQPDFILNREPWRNARILIALDNFGCGSSREHAPWALADFGIGCVIAPSFADIFDNNCFKNGLLTIVAPHAEVERLLGFATDPETAVMKVDLVDQEIQLATGERLAFDVPIERRAALLEGLDEIGRSLKLEDTIARFEAGHTVPPIPAWESMRALGATGDKARAGAATGKLKQL